MKIIEDIIQQRAEQQVREAKWDIRYLRLAREVSTWSKDPSTQTGAVITTPMNQVVSIGFNGFARGVQDTSERLNNRELKYKMIIHCEENALISAARPVFGCTLYTWPFMCCASCASKMVQAGITRFVSVENDNPRWVDSFKLTREILTEVGAELCLYPLSAIPCGSVANPPPA